MEWFTGPIPDAINTSKADNKLFVVFIHDSSETSESILTSINGCSGTFLSSVVAIRLESSSQSAKFFAEIYPYSSVPSLFFINANTGKPVEIITDSISEEDLTKKIKEIAAKVELLDQSLCAASSSTSAVSSPPASPSSSGEVTLECEGDVCRVVPVKKDEEKTEVSAGSSTTASTSPPDSTTNSAVTFSTSASDSTTNSAVKTPLEERIAKAKELARLKQIEREQELKRKELSDEIQRRDMGKEMRKAKREQEEKEMSDLAAQRRKEKLEDIAARERVKAQIAADRAERETRAALLRGEGPSAPSTPPKPPTASYVPADGMCRLKLRLPDGSSSVASFPVDATLADVHQHVDDNVQRNFKQFKLASSTLQRPFTSDDMSSSLTELGLVPSAIIVIMPTGNTRSSGGSGGVVAGSSFGSILDTFIWLIMTPINTIVGYLRLFIFGDANQNTPRDRDAAAPDSSPTEENAAKRRRTDRPKTAHGNKRTPAGARYRKEGNIHRLGGEDDSDENNTWNGNSTQQM